MKIFINCVLFGLFGLVSHLAGITCTLWEFWALLLIMIFIKLINGIPEKQERKPRLKDLDIDEMHQHKVVADWDRCLSHRPNKTYWIGIAPPKGMSSTWIVKFNKKGELMDTKHTETRAQWIEGDYGDNLKLACASCGAPFEYRTSFCPDCGAKMEGADK